MVHAGVAGKVLSVKTATAKSGKDYQRVVITYPLYGDKTGKLTWINFSTRYTPNEGDYIAVAGATPSAEVYTPQEGKPIGNLTLSGGTGSTIVEGAKKAPVVEEDPPFMVDDDCPLDD